MSAELPVMYADEAMAVLRCSELTLRELLQDGTIPAWKPAKEWIIPRDSFYAAVAKIAGEESVARRAGGGVTRGPEPVLMLTPRTKKPGRPGSGLMVRGG